MAAGRGRIAQFGPGLVLLAAMLWATDAPVRAKLTHELPSDFIVFAEHGFDCLRGGAGAAAGFVFLGLLNAWRQSFPEAGVVTARDVAFIAAIAVTSGVLSLFLYYYGLQFTPASVATLAELGFPLAAVFVNAHFIRGIEEPGVVLGLAATQ